MEELYKKDLNEPDNHKSVVSRPEPDTLECEVKRALGSTAADKASGCNGIPAELFKTLKEDAVKVLHSICQQIWKTQQWPQQILCLFTNGSFIFLSILETHTSFLPVRPVLLGFSCTQ